MGRLANTWSLAKLSWGVLKKDRELLWMPVLSFVVSAVVIAIAIALTFSRCRPRPPTARPLWSSTRR